MTVSNGSDGSSITLPSTSTCLRERECTAALLTVTDLESPSRLGIFLETVADKANQALLNKINEGKSEWSEEGEDDATTTTLATTVRRDAQKKKGKSKSRITFGVLPLWLLASRIHFICLCLPTLMHTRVGLSCLFTAETFSL